MNVQLNPVTGVPYSPEYPMNIALNPIVLLVITVVIILYYGLFSSLGGTSTTPETSGSSDGVFLEVLLWGVFISLALLNGMSYFFNVDITATIKDIFTATPEVSIVVDPQESDSKTTVPEIKLEKQVFHVPDNVYDYENAKAICKAYGGRLASYKEINDAYKEGADWCGFGWSKDQMALYPTQFEKWAHLQKIKGHEHDCGRPGINGGYIDNKNVKFGINCYGYKPEITNEEANLMANAPLYPKTNEELLFDKRVAYWRDKLPEILVAPFNHNNWSLI